MGRNHWGISCLYIFNRSYGAVVISLSQFGAVQKARKESVTRHSCRRAWLGLVSRHKCRVTYFHDPFSTTPC